MDSLRDTMDPEVAIVVLAHNNYADTEECLRSVLALDYPALTVWLVDNGSQDGTAQRVAAAFPDVRVVQTGCNLGVAGGFNAGIVPALQAGAAYVFILNNDTVVEPDLIRVLVREAQAHPEAGILMPKILYYDARDRIWSIGARYRRFPPAIVMIGLNQLDGPSYETPRILEYAPTCGLLIPREVVLRVGLLDDGYFFFYDDWDYSLRVREAGYVILYVPRARLYHKVSRTIQRKGRPPFFWRTWGRSGARFYRRHGQPALLSALVHLGYLVMREGLRNGIVPMWHFIIGAIEGYREPLTPYPTLPAEQA
ncbi:MAG: glycosyltransferase family 2 protein [Candidatus Caldarchaeum sp.]